MWDATGENGKPLRITYQVRELFPDDSWQYTRKSVSLPVLCDRFALTVIVGDQHNIVTVVVLDDGTIITVQGDYLQQAKHLFRVQDTP